MIEREVPMSEFLAEVAKEMKVVTHVTTFAKMNKKAEELCRYGRKQCNMLFAEPEDYKRWVKDLRDRVKKLNEDYPRSRPFEVYSETREWLHICVQGRPDESVVRFSFTNIKRVYRAEQE